MEAFSFEELFTRIRAQPSFSGLRKARRFSKGETIFRQGEVCADVFILTEGLVKLHYLTLDGKEWTKSLIADQGVFGSRASQSLGQPSYFSATCLEHSVVMPLKYESFLSICADDPKTMALALQFMQWLGLKKELREHELLCLSAEERYRNFLRDNAELALRITQTEMARYLGITAIALSRIKGKIKKPGL